MPRKIPNDHIEADLNLDELDATSAETKATYEKIKEYVLKETGLKVSSLYFSNQAEMRTGSWINHTLAKDENARLPQCPQDKEKAIRAALKKFCYDLNGHCLCKGEWLWKQFLKKQASPIMGFPICSQ